MRSRGTATLVVVPEVVVVVVVGVRGIIDRWKYRSLKILDLWLHAAWCGSREPGEGGVV